MCGLRTYCVWLCDVLFLRFVYHASCACDSGSCRYIGQAFRGYEFVLANDGHGFKAGVAMFKMPLVLFLCLVVHFGEKGFRLRLVAYLDGVEVNVGCPFARSVVRFCFCVVCFCIWFVLDCFASFTLECAWSVCF